MRIKFIVLISIVCFLVSCNDSEPIPEPTLHYELPVIFHVLYADKNDRNQYVNKGQMAQLLAACNKFYQSQANTKSANMNLEFTLATKNPKGEVLDEPGVERVRWSTATIDCEAFMQEKNAKNAALLWDPNKYINVMVYTFTNNNILGISHLPYIPASNTLPGLTEVRNPLQQENLGFPYCVSINNTYIYTQGDDQHYYTTDVVTTLAHELGHYLGLLHAFSENGENINLCEDTDHCNDTPTYNRAEYNAYLYKYLETAESNLTAKDYNTLINRKNCSNSEFVSTNIMDYSFSRSNEFTPDQRTRIRHVLSYSPLIPGPKKTSSSTRSISGLMDLPISVIK